MATRRIEQSSSVQGRKSEKTAPLELCGIESMMKFRLGTSHSHQTKENMSRLITDRSFSVFFCLPPQPFQLYCDQWNPNSCRYCIRYSQPVALVVHGSTFGEYSCRQVNDSKGPIKAEKSVMFWFPSLDIHRGPSPVAGKHPLGRPRPHGCHELSASWTSQTSSCHKMA